MLSNFWYYFQRPVSLSILKNKIELEDLVTNASFKIRYIFPKSASVIFSVLMSSGFAADDVEH